MGVIEKIDASFLEMLERIAQDVQVLQKITKKISRLCHGTVGRLTRRSESWTVRSNRCCRIW